MVDGGEGNPRAEEELLSVAKKKKKGGKDGGAEEEVGLSFLRRVSSSVSDSSVLIEEDGSMPSGDDPSEKVRGRASGAGESKKSGGSKSYEEGGVWVCGTCGLRLRVQVGVELCRWCPTCGAKFSKVVCASRHVWGTCTKCKKGS